MKKKALLADAGIGLLLTLCVAGSYIKRHPILEALELKAYDWRAQFRGDLSSSTEIVLVEIDDEAVDRFGRWPWPRSRLAAGIDVIGQAGPKVIGVYLPLSGDARGPGAGELERLRRQYLQWVSARRIVDRGVHFDAALSSAAWRMDADAHLASAIARAGNVVLPMTFSAARSARGRRPDLPVSVAKAALPLARVLVPEGVDPVPGARKLDYPLPRFLKAGASLGHAGMVPDHDGVVRRNRPVLRYGDSYYPSFSLRLVAQHLGIKPGVIGFSPGRSVKLGERTIPLDESNSMLVTFNGGAGTFRYYKFHRLLDGKVPMDAFKDKIVLVGVTASGSAKIVSTPLADGVQEFEAVANAVENILNKRFLYRPEWSKYAELGAIVLAGLLVMFLLPRLRLVSGFIVTLLLVAGLMGAGAYLFQAPGLWIWLKVTYPAVLMAVGYLILIVRRRLSARTETAVDEETDKRIGLAFKEKGMLEPAFEVLKDCASDETVMGALYDVGRRLEKQRKLLKADLVYKHLAGREAEYKDVAARIERLKSAKEEPEAPVEEKAADEKPAAKNLGRYRIIRELGRGAMGVVYLGNDPKINRQVAIKTMKLEEGDLSSGIKAVKERFFREAESAGTLNHPGIVRIYDAGEDRGMCYIAMELLEGEDLTRFITKGTLLAPEDALKYVAAVAEALDYAHSQGIVHRDIKPANIMLLKDGSIRVADFGIARITASSRTATGTVMGTPSYMSPEQVKGKKVDGRSDLFSLTVTLFEFLTGTKPFKAEDIGPLLYQIAFEPEPDPLEINPEMPRSAKAIIHKGLSKNPDDRYQRGSELVEDIRACLESIKSGAAEKEAPAAELSSAPEPAPESSAIEKPVSVFGGSTAKTPAILRKSPAVKVPPAAMPPPREEPAAEAPAPEAVEPESQEEPALEAPVPEPAAAEEPPPEAAPTVELSITSEAPAAEEAPAPDDSAPPVKAEALTPEQVAGALSLEATDPSIEPVEENGVPVEEQSAPAVEAAASPEPETAAGQAPAEEPPPPESDEPKIELTLSGAESPADTAPRIEQPRQEPTYPSVEKFSEHLSAAVADEKDKEEAPLGGSTEPPQQGITLVDPDKGA